MLTYNTFKRTKDGRLTQEEIKLSNIDYGESITDKSHYNPNASSYISNTGAINSNPVYHFPDGIDNGLNMAAITDTRLDVTERDALYQKLKNKTGEEIEKLVKSIEELEQSSNDDNDLNNEPTNQTTE